jgi:phage shock protein PspC (stress-responsive transcriptional regulator)
MTENQNPANAPYSWQIQGLVRPQQGRMIAGVCAGIAQRYGLSATTVRLIAVLSLLLPGPQILVYLLLWVLMPAA